MDNSEENYLSRISELQDTLSIVERELSQRLIELEKSNENNLSIKQQVESIGRDNDLLKENHKNLENIYKMLEENYKKLEERHENLEKNYQLLGEEHQNSKQKLQEIEIVLEKLSEKARRTENNSRKERVKYKKLKNDFQSVEMQNIELQTKLEEEEEEEEQQQQQHIDDIEAVSHDSLRKGQYIELWKLSVRESIILLIRKLKRYLTRAYRPKVPFETLRDVYDYIAKNKISKDDLDIKIGKFLKIYRITMEDFYKLLDARSDFSERVHQYELLTYRSLLNFEVTDEVREFQETVRILQYFWIDESQKEALYIESRGEN